MGDALVVRVDLRLAGGERGLLGALGVEGLLPRAAQALGPGVDRGARAVAPQDVRRGLLAELREAGAAARRGAARRGAARRGAARRGAARRGAARRGGAAALGGDDAAGAGRERSGEQRRAGRGSEGRTAHGRSVPEFPASPDPHDPLPPKAPGDEATSTR